MKRLRMLLMGAALLTGGSALVSAQPVDHDGRHQVDRDRDRDDRRFRGDHDRDERRFRDRDDDRRFVDRDYHRYVAGERRYFNHYYWTWNGSRWYRRDGRFVFYFNF